MLKKSIVALALVVGFIFTLGAGQSLAMYSPGGSGDLLLGHVYDVRAVDNRPAQWENYYTIRNTSNQWVAFHLRFRAQTKSIEVWDHIILLSPYDVFWFDLNRNEKDGGVILWSEDYETLRNSGLIGNTDVRYSTQFQEYLLEALGFGTGALAELEMGYVEAIGLWAIDNSSHLISSITGDVYADGILNVWDLLYSMWGDRERGDRPAAYAQTSKGQDFIDCPNVLQGEYELGDIVTGSYQLVNMVGFLDFRTDGTTAHRDLYGTNNDGTPVADVDKGVIGYPVALMYYNNASAYTDGLVVGADSIGRNVAWHRNPDVNTTIGPTLLDGDAWLAPPAALPAPGNLFNFNEAWSLPDVELRLKSTQLWAYFLDSTSTEPPFFADVTTDVVLTFPTKHHHFFFTGFPCWYGPYNPQNAEEYFAAINTYRAGIKAKWDRILNAPCYMGAYIWDSEQYLDGGSIPEPQPSPGPPPSGTPKVPHEVNVIRVGTPGTILEIQTDPAVNPFTHGQLRLSSWLFYADERITGTPVACQFPILPLTIRKHADPYSPFVVRSAMTQMQFMCAFDTYSAQLIQLLNLQP